MFLPDVRLQLAAITLAEELNYTRAAQRLRISQPALSKQIIELESRLGYAVFTHGQKKPVLTEAGQVFVRGCKDSLAILEKSVRMARAAQDDAQPVVSIGHGPYIDPRLLASLLAVHLPLFPTLRLRVESMFCQDLVHSVLSAELDIAITEDALENPHLTQVSLSSLPLHCLMSAEHVAARKRSVAIDDFRDVGWMFFPKRAAPVFYDKFLLAAHTASVSPVELHHYMGPQEVVRLINENFGVAFMPQGVAEQLVTTNIVARPFDSLEFRVTSKLLLRADQTSRLVNEFGRAFLKKAIPNQQEAEESGQMLLKL